MVQAHKYLSDWSSRFKDLPEDEKQQIIYDLLEIPEWELTYMKKPLIYGHPRIMIVECDVIYQRWIVTVS